jgi:hypothetical protein
MESSGVPPGYWLASDGQWYPPDLHPDVAAIPRDPPSAGAARIWTALAVLWLWFLLPVAIHFQRKARREAAESGGRYAWPRTIWTRPVLLWLIVLAATFGLVLVMVAVGMYGDPGPS